MSTTSLSGDQVLRQVYNPTDQSLKVDIVANISGAQEVIISSATDSIAIGNPSGTLVKVTPAGALQVDGSAVTQPISAASLPLPTGAATSTNQATGNASLASIDSKLTSPITITGALTDTQLRASPVPVSGTVTSTPSGVQTTSEERVATSTLSSVASSATSVTLLALNVGRKNATFFNDSTQVLYLKLGATASATSYTVQLVANAYYELPLGRIYTGIVDGIWASANGAVRVTELT